MAFEVLPATGAKIETQPTLANAEVKRQVVAIGAKDGGAGDPLAEIRDKLIEAPAEEGSLLRVADAVEALQEAAESSDPVPGVGISRVVSATPTVSASPAYTAGDCIGSKMIFAGMARIAGLTGLVQTAMIHCKSAQSFAADLIIFHTDPGATSFVDNAAVALNAADFDKIALRIPFVAADWSSLGTPSVAEVSAQGKMYKAPSGQVDLYGVLVARGTLTLASPSDLKVTLKAMLD